jgi:hypothetical protein
MGSYFAPSTQQKYRYGNVAGTDDRNTNYRIPGQGSEDPDDWGAASTTSFGQQMSGLYIGADGTIQLPSRNPGGSTPKVDEGFGWNKGTANMISAGLGGIGNLARGWAAIKGLGIAEDQLEENKRQYNQNFGMQQKAMNIDIGKSNNRTREVNAWKAAQGRTDMRDLIPVG